MALINALLNVFTLLCVLVDIGDRRFLLAHGVNGRTLYASTQDIRRDTIRLCGHVSITVFLCVFGLPPFPWEILVSGIGIKLGVNSAWDLWSRRTAMRKAA